MKLSVANKYPQTLGEGVSFGGLQSMGSQRVSYDLGMERTHVEKYRCVYDRLGLSRRLS